MKFLKYFFLFLLITNISHAQKQITVEDIWQKYVFYPKSVPGFNFLNDGKHFTRLRNNTIKKYDVTTGNFVEDILSGNSLAGEEGFSGAIGSYTFSKDESKILIKSNSEKIYRRSSKAFFHVYDFKTKKLTAIYEEDKIMHATFSPDASKVAYVWKNNLYWFDLETGITLPISLDGKKNEIINGSADWVYEEEFSFTRAFWWSEDSKRVAYIRFDETEVPEFTMTLYKDELYPVYDTFKYPKVGEKNAKVSVHIYNTDNDAVLDVDMGDLTDMYIPRLKWTKDPESLCVYKMNRHQNHLQLLLADASTGSTKVLLDEKNKYYIDITDNHTFLEDGKHFIWTSEKDGYDHIYLYDMNGKEVRQLTSGKYDITKFYGVDEKEKCIFYQSAEKSPLDRHVYSVDLKGNKKSNLTEIDGTSSAQFSGTFDYFVRTNSNINKAASYIVFDRKGSKVRDIELNEKMEELSNSYNISPAEFLQINTEEGVTLNAYMIKPPNFTTDKEYPVLMYVYGGPGSQTVHNEYLGFNYWWFQMLAQKGYIVVSVDNRGTGFRGEEFKKMTYLQLGKYETIDQINSAKYLGSLPYVDASRIGIFGWSYGGYMSSLCILKGNDVFKSAIAVAPVTSWKWYDTIYTERYMRTLEENESGYNDNSPIYFCDRLKGHYLLVHGVADDNVHFQNAVEMANALIKAGKQFDTYYYPNRNHGIYGGNARHHLYTKMTNFLLETL